MAKSNFDGPHLTRVQPTKRSAAVSQTSRSKFGGNIGWGHTATFEFTTLLRLVLRTQPRSG